MGYDYEGHRNWLILASNGVNGGRQKVLGCRIGYKVPAVNNPWNYYAMVISHGIYKSRKLTNT